MTSMTKASWWNHATQEQRFAQVKAGIELGLTAKQIAMNLRAPIRAQGNAVNDFALNHGLRFTHSKSDAGKKGGKAGGKVSGILNARRVGKPEIFASDAFDIFPRSERDEPLFEETYA